MRLILFFVGYALIVWPFTDAGGEPTFGGALRIGGSSLFTLGFAAPTHAAPTAIVLVIAATGIVVVALKIAYLPTLYAMYGAREAGVAGLRTRIGAPPWGVDVLARHYEYGISDALPDYFGEWCSLVSEMSIAHSHYPVLVYFRASMPDTSWITSLLAMLDAASLYVACRPDRVPHQCHQLLLVAPAGLNHLTETLGIASGHADVVLTRAPFDDGLARLREADFPIEADDPAIWDTFCDRRRRYAASVGSLSDLTLAPPAPWSQQSTRLT